MTEPAEPLVRSVQVERKPKCWLFIGYSRMLAGMYRQNGAVQELSREATPWELGEAATRVASTTADGISNEIARITPAMKYLGMSSRTEYMRGTKMVTVYWSPDGAITEVAPSRRDRGEFAFLANDLWLTSAADAASLGEAILAGIKRCP